ncbi:MAG TPA: low-specificity L-threonine aldolase [Dictyoglomaceae bacterium]|nr:low-specificity L-threonine aldolase [Dictyoglomaceae bacterium]HOL39961.1 low-specificity L-threonine aldolase [Dictyoglomaceae bacterium]HOP95598.1 low-specificity L-threonine aldolase [Dictyoglomaceae bacterium]HPP16454.1 low-specificity L-threonine aldolase [Dictyoglomaceae bacterium]HPU43445.1 low-specificity L-threonine aldolase [Dictyoglomaceae bacterium]
MKYIDLRSDTVTKPTEEMRRAMYEAEVGDDGYGEDPTVNLLEEKAAKILGKEAALFVVSGTMGNQLAALSWTRPGEEVILEAESHMFYYEAGGLAANSGVQPHLIYGEDGMAPLEKIEKAIRPEGRVFPKTSLIVLENTHNRAGGKVLPLDYMREVYELSRKYQIPIHLDGARIFNATVFLKVDPKEIAKYADSVMFCLSKGLSCPMGSLLTGPKEFIERARKNRQRLGGGLRQAGVVASCGLIALDKMVDRLEEDHENAKKLYKFLKEIAIFDVKEPDTNILKVKVKKGKASQFIDEFKKYGLLSTSFDEENLRFITHKDVSSDDIDKACEIIERAIKNI